MGIGGSRHRQCSPGNYPTRLMQLILTTLVVRLRYVRLGIVMYILASSFGILAALLDVLT